MSETKNAPDAWQGGESVITTNTNQEQEMNGSSLTESTDNREVVSEWVTDLLLCWVTQADQVLQDESFIAWANEQIAVGPWDMDDCVARALRRDHFRDQWPLFPRELLPSWVADVELGSEMGGEIDIVLRGREHRHGGAAAHLNWGLTVVVGPNGRNASGGQDEPTGTVHWFSSSPDVDLAEIANELDSWRAVADVSRVLADLADEMKTLEEAQAR